MRSVSIWVTLLRFIDLAALRLSFAASGVTDIETGVQKMKQVLALV
jgi:hypothetical protein